MDVPTLQTAALTARKSSDARALQFAKLAHQGRADQNHSRDLMALDYADTTVFTEQWANLTSWGSISTLQVSGGKLFSATPGATAGANHSFALASGTSPSPIPNAPTLAAAAGGNLAAGTYSVRVSQGSGSGEAQVGAAATITVTAGQKINVTLQAGTAGQSSYSAIYMSVVQDGNQANERLVGIVTSGTAFTIADAAPAALSLAYALPGKLPSHINRTGSPAPMPCRYVGSITVVTGTAGGYTLLGHTSDTAGGAFTSGAATMTGIGVNTTGVPQQWVNGTATALQGSALPAGTYTVLIDVGEIDVSYQLVDSVGHQIGFHVARSTVTFNNLAVYISDTRTTAGNNIGPLGVRAGRATITPRTNVEGVSFTASNLTLGNRAGRLNIWYPPSIDSRKACPVILAFHPFGGIETFFTGGGNPTQIAKSLNAAGFIVASVAFTQEEMGNQSLVDLMEGAYRYLRETAHIGPVGIWSTSMGGVGGQMMIAQKRVPALAWYGIVPVCSLSAVYADTVNFSAAIDLAYSTVTGTLSAAMATVGLTSVPTTASFPTPGTIVRIGNGTANVEDVTTTAPSTGTAVAVTATTRAHLSGDAISDYPTKTAGHDPMLRPPTDFHIPMRFVYSSFDTLVPPAQHTLLQAPRLAATAPEVTYLDTFGPSGHSDSANYQGADAALFFTRYLLNA